MIIAAGSLPARRASEVSTFYAAVVVPVGQEVFGHTEQSFLTRRVTLYLNISGLIALVPLAIDVALASDASTRGCQDRGPPWIGMMATLALVVLAAPALGCPYGS